MGQVCCRWNQDLKQVLWKMWLHGNFLVVGASISSRQMMQTLSVLASSSAVASGYLYKKEFS